MTWWQRFLAWLGYPVTTIDVADATWEAASFLLQNRLVVDVSSYDIRVVAHALTTSPYELRHPDLWFDGLWVG